MPSADVSASAAEGAQERPASLGAILRAAREKQRLSFHQLSEELRIEPKFLIALEEERFDTLGAPVFVKGYLKNYSEALGLDSRPLLAAYRSRYGQDETLLVQARKSIERGQESPPIGAWIAAGVTVALVGAFFWLRPGSDAPVSAEREAPVVQSLGGETAGAVTSAASSDAVAAGTRSREADIGAGVAGQESDSGAIGAAGLLEQSAVAAGARGDSGADPSAASEADAGAAGAGASVSETDIAAGAGASVRGSETSAGASIPQSETGAGASVADPRTLPTASVAATEARVAAPTPGLSMELRFIEDSWAEITARDNERLFYGLGRAGSEARFTAAPPVAVLLGNADGVDLLVEGETFPYPVGSRRGRLARFTLTASAE